MRFASALLLGLVASTEAQHLELLRSASYHHEIRQAGQQKEPFLVAYLNESTEEYSSLEAMLETAANDFHCLSRTGVMLSGTEARATFIVTDEQLTLPAFALFRENKKVATFDGNWSVPALRSWVYRATAGITLVDDKAELKEVAGSVPKMVAAYVPELCSKASEQVHKALLALAEKRGGFAPAAMTTSADLAGAHEMKTYAAPGAVMIMSGAEGAASHFPADKMKFTEDELEGWLAGLLSGVSTGRRRHKLRDPFGEGIAHADEL